MGPVIRGSLGFGKVLDPWPFGLFRSSFCGITTSWVLDPRSTSRQAGNSSATTRLFTINLAGYPKNTVPLGFSPLAFLYLGQSLVRASMISLG